MYSCAKVLIDCATRPLTPIMNWARPRPLRDAYTYALAFLNDFIPAANAARLEQRPRWRVQRQRRFLSRSLPPGPTDQDSRDMGVIPAWLQVRRLIRIKQWHDFFQLEGCRIDVHQCLHRSRAQLLLLASWQCFSPTVPGCGGAE